MRLEDVFRKLKENPSGHAYTVMDLPGYENAVFGVDLAGHPVLFVRADKGALEPSLHTKMVSLYIGNNYFVSNPEGVSGNELLHALCCETDEPTQIETFIVLSDSFLKHNSGNRIERDDLISFFGSMVRLFEVTPARDVWSEQLGLWGELFMMSRVLGFRFWMPFWHNETTRRFDFSYDYRRLEVKTTTRPERIHHFSHRQIYAMENEEISIISLVVKEDDSGLSLRQLIQDCRKAILGTPGYLKLEKAVRQAGMDQTTDVGPKFDALEAETSLAWFRSTDIPHFWMPEPEGVTGTRYKVDLSAAPRITSVELDEWLKPWCLAN